MATSPTEMDIPAPLLHKLAMVRRRKLLIGIGVAALVAVVVLTAGMAGAMFIDWTFTLFDSTSRMLLLLTAMIAAVATLVLGIVWTIRRARTLTTIAADIDREVPQLEERWSTVTEISARSTDQQGSVHSVMMGRVTNEALQWAPQVSPQKVVSWQEIRRPLGVLAGIVVVLFGALLLDWRQTAVLIGRFWMPNSNFSMTAIDGLDDIVVARGEELTINAELNGRAVDEATIFVRPHDQKAERQILFPRGEAPQSVRFRQRSAEDSFEYRIRAGDGQSDWHGVIVADRPELSAVTVKIIPPEYTKREQKELRSLPEKLSAIEGSVFEIALRPEADLQSLQLEFGDKSTASLKAGNDGWYRWQRVLDESFALTPILTEPNGLKNSSPPVCRIDVMADQAPEVKIITPNDSIAVRPDDTIDIEFEAKDDFGISHAELVVYDESNGEPQEILTVDIPLDLAGDPKKVSETVELDLSQLDLKDGQSVSYAVRVHDTRQMSSEDSPNSEMASNSANNSSNNPATPNESSTAASDATGQDTSPEEQVANSAATEPSTNNEAEVSEDSAFPGQENVADANSQDMQQPTTTANQGNSQANDSSPSPQSNSVAANENPSNANSGQNQSQSSPGQQSPSSQSPSSPSQPSQSTAQNSSPSNGSPSESSSNSGNSSGSPSQQSMASNSQPSSSNSPSQSSPPGDNMTRRSLDVGTSQAGSSARMSLTVDRWAGSFDGQSREKIEMAIAPVIEEIDQQLEKAENNARGLLDHLSEETAWHDSQSQQLQVADRSVGQAIQLIDDLSLKTEETPYAFVGLTLVDISQSQIVPAQEEFRNGLQSDSSERQERILAGWRYVQRARQLIAALNTQYEKVRRDYQLAESVERIKQMYQVYIENAHALLGSGGTDDLGGLQRKMAEFELDDEYLARLKEVLEMRQELMAEFARMLSDDPRLLRRYMDRLRDRTKTLRYELAELTDRQKALAREVRAQNSVDEQGRATLQRTILKQRLLEFETVSTEAAELSERFRIWLPLDIEIKDGSLAEARGLTTQIAASSQELLAAVGSYGSKSTDDATTDKTALRAIYRQAQGLTRQLGSLDAALRRVTIEDDRQDLADHQVRRLLETQNLMAQTDAWLLKIKELGKGNYHLTAEVDQHQLTADTAQLAGKLADIENQLAGSLQTDAGSLPEPIAEKAQELLTTLDEEVAISQLSAVYALRENEIKSAMAKQGQAVTAMEKAEQLLQELLTMAITEMDKLPVQDPLASALDDPTLDELLAALEQELDSADDLGIPPRPSNLNVVSDMMTPGQGQGQQGQGSGSGMMGLAMQLGMANQKLQESFEKAYKEALARALKEKRVTRASAEKHLKRAPDNDPKRWLVGSELGDDLLQGSSKMAPEQYRQAIEQYFDQISNLRQPQAEGDE